MSERNLTLLTDFYELTMMQGYFKEKDANETVIFDAFYRNNPVGSGYSICAGLDQVIDYVKNLHFDDDDVDYLRTTGMFEEDFLDYLRHFHFSGDIYAIPEGSVIFPREPLVKIIAPIMEAQLIETALLNIINHQSLIATKAARVVYAAQGDGVMEFGLRRAQGAGGGMWASRAAVVGGCASTSNVLAGKTYGLPVSGTHAHSWVMSFPSELEAFRAYAREFPRNCVLLVDTYDVEQGIRNAITVGLEMRARGERLAGIRIDSGDLAWLAKMARRMLDEAGLGDCGIVLSNDLDEYTIQSILDEGAPVSSWGVGTKLACAFDQPTLGGVYKLSATRAPGEAEWVDRLKISELAAKLTVPGVLDVRRYYNDDGTIAGDMVFDVNAGVDEGQVIVDPLDSMRRKKLAGKWFSTMLEPLARNGQVVLDASGRSAMEAQRRCREGLACLDESQKRMLNPHTYPVGLEYGLCERRRALVGKLRGIA